MQFPKLTPLQSRFAASFAASLLLVILYLTFSSPHFAYALEADSIEHRDHNHPLLLDLIYVDQGSEITDWNLEDGKKSYEPEFAAVGRSIVGRAPDQQMISGLSNNIPGKMDISGGQQQYWSFSKSDLYGQLSSTTSNLPPSQRKRGNEGLEELEEDAQTKTELKRRQSGDRMLYLTLNVCDQPSAILCNSTTAPPPLQLFVSQNSGNQYPGPSASDLNQAVLSADYGYANYTITTSDDIFIGIDAPSDPSFQGSYNYEITASIDAPYTFYEESSGLFYVDSDSKASFFVSTNLTSANASDSVKQQWMTSGSPFSIFVHSQNDPSILGISRSYCGMKNHAQIQGNFQGMESTDVEVGMTSIGGGLPKQQFYVKNLNGSSNYYATMAIQSSYTNSGSGNVNGGGTIWSSVKFDTKNGTDGNCQVIYNLTFCDQITYAVPSNPNNFANESSLATFYDNSAIAYYQNFSYSLEQIACDTEPSAQYSLAANCSTCAAAYKQWLCAVTIPRCAGFSSEQSYLQPRNINQKFINDTVPSEALGGPLFSAANMSMRYLNSSRNPLIDSSVSPGPYKEVLPCKSLCYSLVQNCPALLNFACPPNGRISNQSYWSGAGMDPEGNPMCNIPGAIWGVNGSSRVKSSSVILTIAFIMALSNSIIGV